MNVTSRVLHPCLHKTIAVASLVAVIGVVGCKKPTAEAPKAHDEHEHQHATEGPHGGHILEFGSEDHHAELTHDEATHRIGVYLLGSDAKTGTPIDAKSVTINVAIDGQPYQYVLPATNQTGDAGEASYFEVVSEPLCDLICGDLKVEKARAELRVEIKGTPHVAAIEIAPHHHDHK